MSLRGSATRTGSDHTGCHAVETLRAPPGKPYCWLSATMEHDQFQGSPCTIDVFRPRAGSYSKQVNLPESDCCSTRPWLSRQNAWLAAIDASTGLSITTWLGQ
ncbi:hypothetical protein ACAN107058_23375 [Paracidovorax anthurii]